MPALLLSLIRFVRLLLSGHQAVALENAALRLQLAAFQRKRKRPVLTNLDRLVWIALRRLWSGWRGPLLYVQADTVVRWQREHFRRFWARLSKPHRRPRGRPATTSEIRRLIERMVSANPLWRAPRIHGELKMLGIPISERTVSRILRTLRRPPTQTWKTFLRNHVGQMVSTDFFTVPTVTMRVLFVFIVLEHRRREVLHFNVTEHPTAAWTSQQMVEAFAQSGCAEVSATRSGWRLRQRSSSAARVPKHRRVADRTPESLAESLRRTPDRLDTKRLPEPFRDPERQAS
jgi:putative transposase